MKHSFRDFTGEIVTKDNFTPLQAIRHWCLDCSCGNLTERKACSRKDCPLYPFRNGKSGRTSRPRTEAELKHLADMRRKSPIIP